MTRRSEDLQPSLFDNETPSVELKPDRRMELAVVLEALLREIAAALAKPQSAETCHE